MCIVFYSSSIQQAKKFDKYLPSQEQSCLLLLEVLYLWNAIPQCSPKDLQLMLEGIADPSHVYPYVELCVFLSMIVQYVGNSTVLYIVK